MEGVRRGSGGCDPNCSFLTTRLPWSFTQEKRISPSDSLLAPPAELLWPGLIPPKTAKKPSSLCLGSDNQAFPVAVFSLPVVWDRRPVLNQGLISLGACPTDVL